VTPRSVSAPASCRSRTATASHSNWWRESDVEPWSDSPIPEEHAIRGFHGVTLHPTQPESTGTVLETLGYERTEEASERVRYVAGERASVVDDADERRLVGSARVGTVHHVAFRAADDDAQAALGDAVSEVGMSTTPQKDRQYFRSIYFREPGGVLFEVATDEPGFATDEDVSGSARRSSCRRGSRTTARKSSPNCRRSNWRDRRERREPARRPAGRAPRDSPRRRRTRRRAAPRTGCPSHGMLQFAEDLPSEDTAFVAPQATRATWYPNSFLEPTTENEPWFSSALSLVGDVFDDVTEHVPADRVLVLGSPQGACLGSEFVARNPQRFGGFVAFSGGLHGPEGTSYDYDGSLDGTPVFLGCSDRDPTSPSPASTRRRRCSSRWTPTSPSASTRDGARRQRGRTRVRGGDGRQAVGQNQLSVIEQRQ